MTTLTLYTQPQVPLETEAITPDNFHSKTLAEIAALPVVHGNQLATLGDFFKVEGSGASEIVLKGDLSRVKNLASRMSKGKVTINGNAGMHTGAWMRGGVVEIKGDAGDWTGAEMTGGRIHVLGNAGHGLGGAYRGSRQGMNRGCIIVEGNAGNEVGAAMRRGVIMVKGNAGDFAGAFMIAGSIIVFGKLGIRAGAGSLRGTIVTFQPADLLPTYRFDCTYRPGFLNLIFKNLNAAGHSIPENFLKGRYRRYSGDFNRLGKGEILVYDQR